jgi:hypothetical protein
MLPMAWMDRGRGESFAREDVFGRRCSNARMIAAMTQMPRAVYEHINKTLASERADQSFRIAVLKAIAASGTSMIGGAQI